MIFTPAIRVKRKARISISGISKSGKTYTSLAIATGLANGGKIALVDTEHGNSALYGKEFVFDVANIEPPYHPKKLIDAIKAAQDAGYSVLIADSLSHYWEREGGFLDIHQELTEARKDKNSWAAWQDVNPIWTEFVDTLLKSNMHIIATLRSKTDYATDRDSDGKLKVRKVGLKPIMRDGLEYEFDIVATMNSDHYFIVEGTRFSELDGKIIKEPGADFGKEILSKIEKGDDVKTLTRKVRALIKKHSSIISENEATRIEAMLKSNDLTEEKLQKTITIINQWITERS